jgi:lysozyme family protein
MTASNFTACLAFTLKEEGGFSDNADDPGGITNRGITLRTFQAFQHGATADDLRAISDATVATIYRREYWTVMGCDHLPAGVDLCVFDFGVNAGPARAVGYLQVVTGVRRDGVDGAVTQAAAAKMSPSLVISKLSGLQRAHYQALPGFSEFGEGWIARTERRVMAAIGLIPTSKGQTA